jgi:hypothetical protein
MRTTSRRAAIIAVTIFASGALAWSAVASTGSSGSEPEQRTLQLVTGAPISLDFNDAGHGGPANVLAAHFAVKTLRGAAAGDLWISCTYFATERLCTAVWDLTGGQITVQTVFPLTSTKTDTLAITGGTGVYDGATGQLVNVNGASRTLRTFHLILPDRD